MKLQFLNLILQLNLACAGPATTELDSRLNRKKTNFKDSKNDYSRITVTINEFFEKYVLNPNIDSGTLNTILEGFVKEKFQIYASPTNFSFVKDTQANYNCNALFYILINDALSKCTLDKRKIGASNILLRFLSNHNYIPDDFFYNMQFNIMANILINKIERLIDHGIYSQEPTGYYACRDYFENVKNSLYRIFYGFAELGQYYVLNKANGFENLKLTPEMKSNIQPIVSKINFALQEFQNNTLLIFNIGVCSDMKELAYPYFIDTVNLYELISSMGNIFIELIGCQLADKSFSSVQNTFYTEYLNITKLMFIFPLNKVLAKSIVWDPNTLAIEEDKTKRIYPILDITLSSTYYSPQTSANQYEDVIQTMLVPSAPPIEENSSEEFQVSPQNGKEGTFQPISHHENYYKIQNLNSPQRIVSRVILTQGGGAPLNKKDINALNDSPIENSLSDQVKLILINPPKNDEENGDDNTLNYLFFFLGLLLIAALGYCCYNYIFGK
ncbi:hypothetical protein GINT2_000839 [Glugoides intestinalis]